MAHHGSGSPNGLGVIPYLRRSIPSNKLLSINEKHSTAGNMPTLEASTNYTNFGYYALDCTSDAA